MIAYLIAVFAVSFLGTLWILSVLRRSRMVPPTRNEFPPAESATGDERWAVRSLHSSAGGSFPASGAAIREERAGGHSSSSATTPDAGSISKRDQS